MIAERLETRGCWDFRRNGLWGGRLWCGRNYRRGLGNRMATPLPWPDRVDWR